MIKKWKHLPINSVKLTGGFWGEMQQLVRETVIPYQYKILSDDLPDTEKSHAIANFRAAAEVNETGACSDEFYGMVFQDSDVAKWLEAAAYSLAARPCAELSEKADELIALVGRAQEKDGYLGTFFTVKEPDMRWGNLQECHELYCAGHMIEAGVAYYQCTGKPALLDIVKLLADHIYERFITQKAPGVPGHQEIELALLRLHRVTGDERYRELSQHFLDERGREPDYFQHEVKTRKRHHWTDNADNRYYAQNHAPVREQTTAEGHSVRAMYMYTAMADMAGTTGEEALRRTSEALWDNMVSRRMYITGGIGSNASGEAFTIDYDLPNDSVYAETCASIGLVMFADRMLQLAPDRKYADVMETALYNGIISGMQHDGKRFFYVNPLEVKPGVSGEIAGYKHVLPTRPAWYACACCPPNVARLVMSLGKYAWGQSGDVIFSHLFVEGEASLGEGLRIETKTAYPWDETVTYHIKTNKPARFTLAVRIPAWCKSYTLRAGGEAVQFTEKNGYAYVPRTWQDGDTLALVLEMPVRRVYANAAVRADSGLVCLLRGPVVYCFEEADNGACLSALSIPRDGIVAVKPGSGEVLGGRPLLEIEGVRYTTGSELYSEIPPTPEKQTLTAVPYYLWGNRKPGEMRVWLMER